MSKEIEITEVKPITGIWINVIASDGIKYSINAERSPKLAKTIKESQSIPFKVTGEYANNNKGQHFLWDAAEESRPKFQSTKSSPEKDKSIVIQTCLKCACDLHSDIFNGDLQPVIETAESLIKFHSEMMKK